MNVGECPVRRSNEHGVEATRQVSMTRASVTATGADVSLLCFIDPNSPTTHPLSPQPLSFLHVGRHTFFTVWRYTFDFLLYLFTFSFYPEIIIYYIKYLLSSKKKSTSFFKIYKKIHIYKSCVDRNKKIYYFRT